MGSRDVRWGILGCGYIAGVVAPAIQTAGGGQLVAVASRDPRKAHSFATWFSVPRAYGSYEALLADPEVNAVYIPLPNVLHAPWTIRAAQMGKHILCEKPLAVDVDECDQMIAAAQRAGVLLAEAFMYRFHPQVDWVRQALSRGVAGQLQLIRSAHTFDITGDEDNVRLQVELGGGSLMDVGCDCVHISRLLLGAEPLQAEGMARFGERSGVDETFTGLLRFPGDVLAHFDCGIRAVGRNDCEIVGSEASLYIPNAFQPGTGEAFVHVKRSGGVETAHIPGANPYQLMVEDFNAAIQGGRPPRFPAEDGRANMAVIGVLLEAADRG